MVADFFASLPLRNDILLLRGVVSAFLSGLCSGLSILEGEVSVVWDLEYGELQERSAECSSIRCWKENGFVVARPSGPVFWLVWAMVAEQRIIQSPDLN